ncbi:YbgA family protein [bacterium]|nr:YbgA family protein [bacterium]MCI0603627.1 YbgA family protein [bacterium]
MAKDEKQQRIEGTLGNVGLGNSDPERVAQIVEEYERAMSTADFARHNTGKKKFKDVLSNAEKKGEENK